MTISNQSTVSNVSDNSASKTLDPVVAGAKRDRNTVKLAYDPDFAWRAAEGARVKAELDKVSNEYELLQNELREYGMQKRSLYNEAYRTTIATVAIPYLTAPEGGEMKSVQVICSNKYSIKKDMIVNNEDVLGGWMQKLFNVETVTKLRPDAEEKIRQVFVGLGMQGETLAQMMGTIFETEFKISTIGNDMLYTSYQLNNLAENKYDEGLQYELKKSADKVESVGRPSLFIQTYEIARDKGHLRPDLEFTLVAGKSVVLFYMNKKPDEVRSIIEGLKYSKGKVAPVVIQKMLFDCLKDINDELASINNFRRTSLVIPMITTVKELRELNLDLNHWKLNNVMKKIKMKILVKPELTDNDVMIARQLLAAHQVMAQ